jgi:hypothetical protein
MASRWVWTTVRSCAARAVLISWAWSDAVAGVGGALVRFAALIVDGCGGTGSG